MDLEDVITCKTKVDYAHKSTTTGLPNVHGHVDYDHKVPRIVVRLYIYRSGVLSGSSAIIQSTGRDNLLATANAATCVEANYNGDEAGYVMFPPGYTPAESDFYRSGPVRFVTCGPCGDRWPTTRTTGEIRWRASAIYRGAATFTC